MDAVCTQGDVHRYQREVKQSWKPETFLLSGSIEVSAIPKSFQDSLCPCRLVTVCNKLFLFQIVWTTHLEYTFLLLSHSKVQCSCQQRWQSFWKLIVRWVYFKMSICSFSIHQNRCSFTVHRAWYWSYFLGWGAFFFFFNLFCFLLVLDCASGVIDFFVLETCIVCWINLCVRPVLQTVIIFEPRSAHKGNGYPIVFRDAFDEVELWRAGLLFSSRIKYWGQRGPEPW